MTEGKPGRTFFTSGLGRGLLLLARLVLGGVFIVAAYTKLHFGGQWHLTDYQFIFAIAIDSYKMLPFWAVNWMARFLPWVEVALGTLLMLGLGMRWVGSATIALLLVFMVALTNAVMLRLEICGCYGNNSVSPKMELVNDTGLLILALFVTVGAFLSYRARHAAA
jgi:uncharacterized membrane protein YphA (DoxX/SURF4 family)